MTSPAMMNGERKEICDRLRRFKEFRTSRDDGQRKVWQQWFKKLERLDPLAARALMDELSEKHQPNGGRP